MPEQADSELSESEMIRRNNEELVATWGNLVQRVFTQVENNIDNIGEASDEIEVDTTLLKSGGEAFDNVGKHIEKIELKAALQEAMRYVSKVNNAIPKESNKQWSMNSIKIGTQIETIGHLFKKFD